MSGVQSQCTVGITELMNFRKMISAWCGLMILPLALLSPTNRFMTSECLQGWMVSMRHSRKGQFSSVTVSFWYQEQMSSKICLEVRGAPLKAFPLIHSRGVKQQSSQLMYMLYLRMSSSRSSTASSPSISTNPCSLPAFSTICCCTRDLIRAIEVAGAVRYCFSAGSSFDGLPRDDCHFHPKLLASWSPAWMN